LILAVEAENLAILRERYQGRFSEIEETSVIPGHSVEIAAKKLEELGGSQQLLAKSEGSRVSGGGERETWRDQTGRLSRD